MRGLSVILLVLFCACASNLLRPPDVHTFNMTSGQKVYVASRDIYATYSDPDDPTREPIFPRGTRLRLYAVSHGDWLKIRAYPADDSRESSAGHTVLYVIRDILEERGVQPALIDRYTLEAVDERLSEILQEVPE